MSNTIDTRRHLLYSCEHNMNSESIVIHIRLERDVRAVIERRRQKIKKMTGIQPTISAVVRVIIEESEKKR
jgi:hypothetical protein